MVSGGKSSKKFFPSQQINFEGFAFLFRIPVVIK